VLIQHLTISSENSKRNIALCLLAKAELEKVESSLNSKIEG
jgi:hypothetical protein